MSKTTTRDPGPTEHRAPEPPSEQDYLAWKDAKIKRALQAAKDRPEDRIPQVVVWKKFGLES